MSFQREKNVFFSRLTEKRDEKEKLKRTNVIVFIAIATAH